MSFTQKRNIMEEILFIKSPFIPLYQRERFPSIKRGLRGVSLYFFSDFVSNFFTKGPKISSSYGISKYQKMA
jgi:hypothetical protein